MKLREYHRAWREWRQANGAPPTLADVRLEEEERAEQAPAQAETPPPADEES